MRFRDGHHRKRSIGNSEQSFPGPELSAPVVVPAQLKLKFACKHLPQLDAEAQVDGELSYSLHRDPNVFGVPGHLAFFSVLFFSFFLSFL